MAAVVSPADDSVAPSPARGHPRDDVHAQLNLFATGWSLRAPARTLQYRVGMATRRSNAFVALGSAGSHDYAGLETFPNPGVAQVELRSDELIAVCPITGQPDMYVAQIEYRPGELCLETKSLKLYLMRFRDEGEFCEALAVRIRDDVATVLQLSHDEVRVTLVQKARGGISITATT
jgi:7-cyano-7-deazaguanine reductase